MAQPIQPHTCDCFNSLLVAALLDAFLRSGIPGEPRFGRSLHLLMVRQELLLHVRSSHVDTKPSRFLFGAQERFSSMAACGQAALELMAAALPRLLVLR